MRIYLAGGDSFAHVLYAARYPYRLCSYRYVQEAATAATIARYVNDGSHWIMDSGLFSYMFGSDKGKLTTFADYASYAERYLESMRAMQWKHVVVEADVQRVLGCKETWKLREKFFEPSGFNVMYVWHLPEGEQGLRDLARRYEYIALSVPEFRMLAMKDREAALIRALRVIREERGTTAKVHLLGNTENRLLRLPAFSSDSTSWLGGGRWGRGVVFDSADRQLRATSVYSPKWRAWKAFVFEQDPKAFETLKALCLDETYLGYSTMMLLSAYSHLLYMEVINGRTEERTKLSERTTSEGARGLRSGQGGSDTPRPAEP